jgi:hypothetical protein
MLSLFRYCLGDIFNENSSLGIQVAFWDECGTVKDIKIGHVYSPCQLA